MPKQSRPTSARIPRLQWAMLLILTAFVATGSLFSTGCALVDTSNDSDASGNANQNRNNNNNNANGNANNNANGNANNNNNNSNPTPTPTPVPTAFSGPQQSSTIAVSNDAKLAAVNPEANSVSFFNVAGSAATSPVKFAEVTVPADPRAVVLSPLGNVAYVACSGSAPGKVAIVDVTATSATLRASIDVGIEPMALVMSPNGGFVYVANAVSNTISVINTVTNVVDATRAMPVTGSTQPRALAITNDGDAFDNDETVYIANFFAALRPGKTGADEGQDDQREGHVFAMSTANNVITATPIVLAPTATGFASNGSTLDVVNGSDAPNPVNPANNALFQTTCYPNQLASIALHPDQTASPRAYVVGTAASPNGPVRFNVNVHGLVSVINTTSNTELVSAQVGSTGVQSAPLNLNRGVQNVAAGAAKLFNSSPTAIRWNRLGTEAWVAIQTTDRIVKMTVDSGGVPTIAAPLTGPSGVAPVSVDLQGNALVGRAPFGLVYHPTLDILYVNNFVSRTINAINPAAASSAGNAGILASVQSSDPIGGSTAQIQLGARLFFSGRENGTLSSEGWGACIACHPDGRADGVTWMFGPGPRQTISLDGQYPKTGDLNGPPRMLNFSAIVDESQDFENNSRGVSGGRGLITDDRQVIFFGGHDVTFASLPPGSVELTAPPAVTTPLTTLGRNNTQLPGSPPLTTLKGVDSFGYASTRTGQVYVGGGLFADSSGTTPLAEINELDPSTNTTRTRGTLSAPRYFLGAAAVEVPAGAGGAREPRVYFIGGYDNSGITVNTVEELDPLTGTVRTVASLPVAVAEAGVCTVQGNNTANDRDRVWVVGGNAGVNEGATGATTLVQVFTPPQDGVGMGSWTTINNLITVPRRRPVVASVIRVATNSVFTIGGFNDTTPFLADVEEFTAANLVGTRILTPIAQLPNAIQSAAVAVSQNQIFIAGGLDETNNVTTAVYQFNPSVNPTVTDVGAAGRPKGVWTYVANVPVGFANGGAYMPQPVNSFVPVGNTGRSPDQDAIDVWIKAKVRPHVAINRGATGATLSAIGRGRTVFTTVDAGTGVSCATCHGGPKWTRSTRDYLPAPTVSTSVTSPGAGGNEEIIGVEMRKTATQPGTTVSNGVLVNVGTFTAATIDPVTFAVTAGTVNEVRTSPADVGQRIGALGANGFNIPSLISVGSTAPYFHSGAAQTLEDVVSGVGSGQGASSLKDVHTVAPADQADLVEFLKSIDETTATVP